MRRPFLIVLPLLAACESSPRNETSFESGMTGGPGGPTSSPSTGSSGAEGGSVGSGSTAGSGPILDVGAPDTDGSPGEIAEVFGHSGDTLYRLDPDTNAVTTVGAFTGVVQGSIIDLALDADSQMYGTTFGALYAIDKQTAQATLIAQGDYPTSLSFVPAGTVDPDEEALVGYVDADYVRIDVDTGTTAVIGSLSDGLQSSGDIVSVKDGGTYLTVIGPACDSGDCIIEVDPTTGEMIQNFGLLPYQQVFGLGFWGGIAYGFAREGVLFEVEFVGNTVSTTPIDMPGSPTVEWFGAGSTTSAPPAAG